MRLRHLEPWVREWALPEMHAGVPEMGAVDAWMQVMTELESFKLDGKHYCGGAADIAKFFDQIRMLSLFAFYALEIFAILI